MKTTLNKIREYRPCQSGWVTLLDHLGKTKADDEPIEFSTILKAVGIEDAIWCLRTQEYRDVCLFSADVAETVFHLVIDDDRPRLAIQAIRDWHSGKIDDEQLASTARAASDAASDAASYAASAASYAASTASTARYAASYYASAAWTASAASDAAWAESDAASAASWARIEELFVEHFL